MRRGTPDFEVLKTSEAETHQFSTGDTAKILGVKKWRVQKFVDLKSYPLAPSGQLGQGIGFRRVFRIEALYRLGIAIQLLNDGFRPAVVSDVLSKLEDSDLYWNEVGQHRTLGVALSRSKKKPTIAFYESKQLPRPETNGHPFYVLDFATVMRDIDQAVKRAVKSKRK